MLRSLPQDMCFSGSQPAAQMLHRVMYIILYLLILMWFISSLMGRQCQQLILLILVVQNLQMKQTLLCQNFLKNVTFWVWSCGFVGGQVFWGLMGFLRQLVVAVLCWFGESVCCSVLSTSSCSLHTYHYNVCTHFSSIHLHIIRCGKNNSCSSVVRNIESQNHLGWNRPLRLWSPTISPALPNLPPNHAPKQAAEKANPLTNQCVNTWYLSGSFFHTI